MVDGGLQASLQRFRIVKLLEQNPEVLRCLLPVFRGGADGRSAEIRDISSSSPWTRSVAATTSGY